MRDGKLASGDCAAPGNYLTKWDFSYDGDGTRATTLTTPYEEGVPQTAVLTAYREAPRSVAEWAISAARTKSQETM